MMESNLDKFCNGKLNCAQALLLDYMPKEQKEFAIKLMENFAGGLYMQGETCGCIIGTLAALPMVALKPNVTTADFMKAFKDHHESLLCKGILGYDISKARELAMVKEEGLFTSICPQIITFCQNWIEENRA